MDIHESARRFQNVLDKLDSCSHTRGDKENLHGFVEALRVEGISHARMTKYLYSLMTLAILLKKEFASASKKDLQRLVLAIESSDYAAWTKRDFKITLKKYYKWLRNGDGEGSPGTRPD